MFSSEHAQLPPGLQISEAYTQSSVSNALWGRNLNALVPGHAPL